MAGKRKIIITGASRRLGLFLSKYFNANDCKVIALTRSASAELYDLASVSDIEIIEIGDYNAVSVDCCIQKLNQSFKKVDVLIHNASVFEKDDKAGCYSHEQYDQLYNVHMAMPAQLNFGLAPLLEDRETPGNIIHITDIYAENPHSRYILYCSTKAALENLSKGFAKKLAPGVRVNTIQPGPLKFLPSHSNEIKQAVLEETLLDHEGGFMPVFQAISCILENPYITGSSIKVDGGRSLGRR